MSRPDEVIDAAEAGCQLLLIGPASCDAALFERELGAALEVGADGVHLGIGAADVAASRAALGVERILGVSCGRSRDAAMAAGEAGGDYVAFRDLGRPAGQQGYG